jgi:hypothetical protein
MDNWASSGWVWFALALVNAGLAEQKNRSRLSWFLVSLLIGPLATAAIVVWAPADPVGQTPFRPFSDRHARISLLALLGLFVALLFAITAGIAREPWYLAGSVSAVGFSVWLFFRGKRTSPE